ncbi:MAG: protein phosphatase 2C domain-containing protein [Bacilli bacterium]|jgi:serine/threonine protein phosphatase PrpC|nr:protein phosphatase 2C domain-containing protein [Bacilli bacterium]
MTKYWYCHANRICGLRHQGIVPPCPCQDHVCHEESNGVSAIVLSDGCSSSQEGDKAAELTVFVVLNALIHSFSLFQYQDPLRIKIALVEAIIDSFKREMAAHQGKYFPSGFPMPSKKNLPQVEKLYFNALDEFNATLLFVAVKGNQAIYGHIGDGYIGALEDGVMKILSTEIKDEAVNETVYPTTIYKDSLLSRFLASYDRFRLVLIPDVSSYQGFLLMSDGPDSLVDTTIPFERKFRPSVKKLFAMTSSPNQKEADDYLLSYLKTNQQKLSPYAEDDLSLALMVRPGFVPEDIHSYEVLSEKPQVFALALIPGEEAKTVMSGLVPIQERR